MRSEDFDGEPQFQVLLNDEEPSDMGIGIVVMPGRFEVGDEAVLICIHDCHLKEQT
jgi:hypothetical protein